jgi:uncharacterized protein (DUF433 family)
MAPDLDSITHQPGLMRGRPCIRGMRVTVGMIAGQIGAGCTIEEILADFPHLEREDVLQALRYAGLARGRAENWVEERVKPQATSFAGKAVETRSVSVAG